MNFSVHILGCGSALPTLNRNQSSQVVSHANKLFLIDCGEGTQLLMRRNKIKIQKISHVFISHLHGDHYFGLVGLISTMHMLGRNKELNIYGPEGLEEIVRIQFRMSASHLLFEMNFHVVEKAGQVLFEDKNLIVESIPLLHRASCFGFLFKEKKKDRKLIGNRLTQYKVPNHFRNKLKEGADFITEEGEVIKNEVFSNDADKSKSYAYCSDTIYYPEIIPFIKGVDLLYHEATFQKDNELRAKKTFHSTAAQAASIAKQAAVGKLLLGHFSNRYATEEGFVQEAREIFEESYSAVEGELYEV